MSYLDDIKYSAIHLAEKSKHSLLTIEHLLWVMLDSNDTEVIRAITFSPHHEFERDRSLTALRQVFDDIPKLAEGEKPHETIAFHRVLELAQRITANKGRVELIPADLILAIFHEQESPSAQLLKGQHVRREDIEAYLNQPRFQLEADLQQAEAALQQGSSIQSMLAPAPARQTAASRSPIDEFLENLNEKYRKGLLPPVIGRKHEIDATVRILAQSRKSNPLLVGDPGVGKTTIADGLAQLIEEQKVPEVLRNATIYALKLTGLMSGTQYRGEFEKRMDQILTFLKKDKHAILFIDEIHMIIGAGATKDSHSDIANILKPELASGEISCIGATTYKEYRQIFEKDEALKRRFSKVDVPEPSPEETIQILEGLKSRIQKHHRVVFSQSALEAAVHLSKQYIKDRRLPDIAIDVLDEAGALLAMQSSSGDRQEVTVENIQRVIAEKANIPVAQVLKSADQRNFAELEIVLKKAIFGQDHAITTLVSAVTMAHAGLRDTHKPIGSFLFAGPTGVGKTELCKQLAEHLHMRLLRLDMSEYNSQHAYTKLIGTAPGYVGYEQGGELTEAVNQYPHSIVLFDEIEKAHPQIYNLLLQVLDYGTLTDGQARKIDFRHTIIVLTTNAGAEVFQKRTIGFSSEQDTVADSQQELARVFSPEFRNRLDDIIQFNPLPKEVAWSIAEKFIQALQDTLREKNVTLVLTEAAKTWFVRHGYSAQLGARPMARLVTNQLKQTLAKELLYGQLKQGGRVTVDVDTQDELVFFY